MDTGTEALRPLTDSLPEEVQAFLRGGGWWLVGGLLTAVLGLLAVGAMSALCRRLFRRKVEEEPSDRDLDEDLAECPLPVRPPGEKRLTVYHLPARLRLVVVAPLGAEATVDATAVEKLLDRIVPGLGDLAWHDRPRIRIWPGQLSHRGFTAAFQRRLRRPEADGQPSRWILAAGKARAGKQTVLLGLGLWADDENLIGRLTLTPYQWMDVLRLKAADD